MRAKRKKRVRIGLSVFFFFSTKKRDDTVTAACLITRGEVAFVSCGSLSRERGKERETSGVREGLEEREERRNEKERERAVLVVPPPWCIWNLEPLNACAMLSERQRKKETRAESSARLGLL